MASSSSSSSSSDDSTSKAAIIVMAGASSGLVAWLLYKYYNKGKPPSPASSSFENQLLLADQLEPREDDSFTLLPLPNPNAEPRPDYFGKARMILSRIKGQIAGERTKNQIATSSHHIYIPKPPRAATWLKYFVPELDQREEVEIGSLPERVQLDADKFFKSRMSEGHRTPSSSPSSSIDDKGLSSGGNKIVGRAQNTV